MSPFFLSSWYHVWFFLQGQIRLSKKMLDPEKPQLGMIDRWYHPNCFVKNREELGFRPEYSASQLKGFGLLTAEDKETLKKQLPGVKSEGWVGGHGRRGGAPVRPCRCQAIPVSPFADTQQAGVTE